MWSKVPRTTGSIRTALSGISSQHHNGIRCLQCRFSIVVAQLTLPSLVTCYHTSKPGLSLPPFLPLMLSFLLVSLIGLAAVASASDAIFPDCGAAPLQGTPICDVSLPYLTRATVRHTHSQRHARSNSRCVEDVLAHSLVLCCCVQWIVGQMNVSEKVARLQNGSPGVPRLGLPAYQWWSEALHGVAGSPGVDFAETGEFSCATSFPEPIGLGATFDRFLVRALASVTSTEARAFNNADRAGLDFWSALSLPLSHKHTSVADAPAS